MKKTNPVYYCQVCQRNLLKCNTICCDCCLEWLHFSCAGVKSAPKQKEWFYKLCKANNNNGTKLHTEKDKPQVIPNVSRVTFQLGTAANRLRDRRDKKRLQKRNERTTNSEQTITLSSDEKLICAEPEEPEIDIGNGIRVFKSDLNILKNPLGWLNARLINAGQALLRTKFPNLGGLQDVGKSDTCTFDEQIGDFVQVLNCYESHWILVSKMNCKINQVNVYDSSFTGDMPISSKEVIASLVKTHNKHITLTFPAANRWC